jgi:hypothetical protein
VTTVIVFTANYTYLGLEMKKILLIILLVVYSGSSIGVTIHFHYCGGSLSKVDFAANENSARKNGNARHDDSNKCCEDGQVELRIGDYQYLQKVELNYFPAQILQQRYDNNIHRFFENSLLVKRVAYNQRFSKRQRLFLMYRDFRI